MRRLTLIAAIASVAAGCSYDWSVNTGNDPKDGGPDATDSFVPPPDCVRFVNAANPHPSPDGKSWATAFSDIQEGVRSASQSGEACEVWVARGTYYVFRGSVHDTFTPSPGVPVYGGFAGYEQQRDQRDFETLRTVLDGRNGPVAVAHVYHVVTALDGTVLDGFVITAGRATGDSPADKRGAGLLVQDASPTVRNCVFQENHASEQGGGLYVAGGSPVIVDVLFADNTAARGGALAVSDGATNVTRCRFMGNQAEQGGGVFNHDAVVAVASSLFVDNRATAHGGAIYADKDARTSVVNGTFWNNTADDAGGAFYLKDDSRIAATNCILWSNRANGDPEHLDPDNDLTLTYSNVEGGYPGSGNIDINPRFRNTAAVDLHLLEDSPCIDGGDGDAAPDLDLDGNGRRDHPAVTNTGSGAVTYVDMGAFEVQP